MQIEDIDLNPLADEFLSMTMASNDWSNSTLAIREKDLRLFLNWVEERECDFRDLSRYEIKKYLVELKNKGYAPNTISQRFDTLTLFYRFLTEDVKEIDENPLEDMDRLPMMRGTKKHPKSEITYVTPEDVDRLVEHVPKPKLRNRLLIRLLFQTGVRQGEASRIELDDIDREARSIKIYSTKTDHSRTVYYQESLDFLLERWLDRGFRDSNEPARDSPCLFVTNRSERLSGSDIGNIVVKAAENCGLQDVLYTDASGRPRNRITAHTLRHGCAVKLLKDEVPIKMIQEQLGHQSIDTTQVYLQVVPNDVKDLIQSKWS